MSVMLRSLLYTKYSFYAPKSGGTFDTFSGNTFSIYILHSQFLSIGFFIHWNRSFYLLKPHARTNNFHIQRRRRQVERIIIIGHSWQIQPYVLKLSTLTLLVSMENGDNRLTTLSQNQELGYSKEMLSPESSITLPKLSWFQYSPSEIPETRTNVVSDGDATFITRGEWA